MTLNCRYGRANATEIVRAVRERDVAVLALQEMSPELVDELDAAGIDELLPFRQLGDATPSDNGGFNGLFLRVKPESSTPTGVAIPAADVPTVTVPVTDTEAVVIASAHPKSPMRGCRDWSAGIIGLGELADRVEKNNRAYLRIDDVTPATTFTGKPTFATGSVDGQSFREAGKATGNDSRDLDDSSGGTQPAAADDVRVAAIGDRSRSTVELDEANAVHVAEGAKASDVKLSDLLAQRDADRRRAAGTADNRPTRELVAVVMGDLNSSIVHPSFRKLLQSGFKDAVLVQATGPQTTFPSWLPWPRIVLDHILFTGRLAPKDVESFRVDGSDHLALAATLHLGPRSATTTVPEIVRNGTVRK
ncbi:hypothetical protein F6S87_04010 [Bifidobacterium sp. BRDM6]|uniref:Endonuclease/exonuclease/phosphatase domain-containing protein n=2 Tax=Bifidobacterium choloepi TaxID=2614131 RepID=A0A6I5NM23_9BIFI|nr:hypothetical protein [Bifidobacterium choloepi]